LNQTGFLPAQNPQSRLTPGRPGTRNDLNPVNFRALNVGLKSNVELAVGDVYVDSFDIGALAPPALAQTSKSLKFMAAYV